MSRLRSVIFSGEVDGKPFNTETTLLPETRTIEWSPGQPVEARVSQYHAYLDGRIEEVALDYYAQADDGSVWYLGEDVYDYDRGGLVDSTLGSWLAGREGPPEMIMPADPKVGDVHRAENIPAIAFEEVEIKTVGKTVDGPAGPVKGVIVGRELHDDGTYSDKVFAPGYGEFYSAHEGDTEALALAVPTDALTGPPPAELEALSRTAGDVVDPARSGDWKSATTGSRRASRAWAAYRGERVPPRLSTEMDRALEALRSAIDKRDRARAAAAIDVAQSVLDLELRHRPPAEIDLPASSSGRRTWANRCHPPRRRDALEALSSSPCSRHAAEVEHGRDRRRAPAGTAGPASGRDATSSSAAEASAALLVGGSIAESNDAPPLEGPIRP